MVIRLDIDQTLRYLTSEIIRELFFQSYMTACLRQNEKMILIYTLSLCYVNVFDLTKRSECYIKMFEVLDN